MYSFVCGKVRSKHSSRDALVRAMHIASRRLNKPAMGYTRGIHDITVYPSESGRYSYPMPKPLPE